MLYYELSAKRQSMEVGKVVSFRISCDKSLSDISGGFAVNFQEDNEDYENIAFHFNPRAESSKVVLNTRIRSKWIKEHIFGDNKVKSDYYINPFKLTIEVKNKEHILISVNDKFITGYNCKLDITKVKYVCWANGVEIDRAD
ncbi:Hypothetical predicted protein [Mytilus galloprovincialis]|uniref:Galectin n=2 Tax=Mytilus galloprovincialis TaxID=29158 RepID=A0A8B6CZ76_MYTGA|nr:Hypothetical predicted protein [Mytilus galloprovincialis]